ncbi:glycosyltransferase family 4 protein [Vulcaniibacterium tengchongense]|uniref:Glycosyltransferase involved in cell wall biosynthesis n=1 Tax=Vulcaniibacterium tengchongense TaxID=1273429 RepID=A0A3N4VD36_9GAMM|nr:glycosyltransferase family 4 protein [Vulcaniibacterium tengchongense]RPE80916.1 glycosyltransferase involved in cell wall biosynthesis [Vulcaniibacterium tengchongense]
MRIAHIAPLYESVPPRLYGGTERIVAYLADAQVDLGHDVTVFASGDSATRARLVPSRECAIRLDPEPLKSDVAAHLAMLHEVRRRASEFDVLHFHVDLLHFPMFEDIAERTLTTLHGRLDLADLTETYRRWPRYPLVSISDQQRLPLRFAKWIGTVHHGLPKDLLAPVPSPSDGYLAFLGRISPEKRPDRAIAIARDAGVPLRVAAKVDVADRVYYHDRIEPMLDGSGVTFIGEIGEADKRGFLGNARALLFPIDWPEPFGLVMIEAMACGTPVIAWNRGSVREVIDHGVTGFIVESHEQAVEAVKRLPELDRAEIRRVFERRFSASVMAQRYLDLYRRLAGASSPPERNLARIA